MSKTEDKRDRERRRAPNSHRRQRITKEPEARRQEIIETALALLEIPFPADLTAAEKLKIMIDRIFRFTMDHRELEFRCSGGEDLRAVYLDKVAGQWCGLMLPVIRQGIDDGQFQCDDPQAAAHFLLYGLIHTFRRRMPDTRAEDYMVSFLNFTYDMFSRVLGLPEGIFPHEEPHSQQ